MLLCSEPELSLLNEWYTVQSELPFFFVERIPTVCYPAVGAFIREILNDCEEAQCYWWPAVRAINICMKVIFKKFCDIQSESGIHQMPQWWEHWKCVCIWESPSVWKCNVHKPLSARVEKGQSSEYSVLAAREPGVLKGRTGRSKMVTVTFFWLRKCHCPSFLCLWFVRGVKCHWHNWDVKQLISGETRGQCIPRSNYIHPLTCLTAVGGCIREDKGN